MTAVLPFFDFDSIDDWNPFLSETLSGIVPIEAIMQSQSTPPEYIEDARDLVIRNIRVDKKRLYGAVESWLCERPFRAYHGTRLFPDELNSIQQKGLVPTTIQDRVNRTKRVLQEHPDWNQLRLRFEPALHEFLNKHHQKVRAGQVHLTISRGGVTHGFNHYLVYGAEFDQRFIQLLTAQGRADIMKRGTTPYLLTFEMPGDVAVDRMIAYANKFAAIRNGEPFDLIRKLIGHWAWKQFFPEFSSGTQEEDLGLVFYEIVRPEWLVRAEEIQI
ncbi:hypothetical protein [Dongia sp.]|uniref:hypothetical protein n=1 Tax=Dongia sp. TaxID=1977262 RepID=UPI0035ADC721